MYMKDSHLFNGKVALLSVKQLLILSRLCVITELERKLLILCVPTEKVKSDPEVQIQRYNKILMNGEGGEFYNQTKYFKFTGFHFCNESKFWLLKKNKQLLNKKIKTIPKQP